MSEVRFYNINTDKLESITQEVVDTLFASCMVNVEIMSAIEALTSIRRQFAAGNITKDALFAALGPVHRAAMDAEALCQERQSQFMERAQ